VRPHAPTDLANFAGGKHNVVELLDHLAGAELAEGATGLAGRAGAAAHSKLRLSVSRSCVLRAAGADALSRTHECSLASSVNLAMTSPDASMAALSSRHLASSLTRMWLAEADAAAAVPTRAVGTQGTRSSHGKRTRAEEHARGRAPGEQTAAQAEAGLASISRHVAQACRYAPDSPPTGEAQREKGEGLSLHYAARIANVARRSQALQVCSSWKKKKNLFANGVKTS
jgi:hypothetical protein